MQKACILNTLTKLQPYKSDQVKVEQRSCQWMTLTSMSNWLPHRLNFQKLLKGTGHPFGRNCFKRLCHVAWKGWEESRKERVISQCTLFKINFALSFSRKSVSIVWNLFGWLLGSPFPKGMAGKEIHWKIRKTSIVLWEFFLLKNVRNLYTPWAESLKSGVISRATLHLLTLSFNCLDLIVSL